MKSRSETDPVAQLKAWMHADIPLTRHIDVRISHYDQDSLTLSAPLSANSNHKGTAFGGSLFSLAVLAGWGLLSLKLEERNLQAELVIQDSRVEYLVPVRADFSARATLPGATEFDRFVRMLERRGKARIRLAVVIAQDGNEAVRFEGTFAAVAKSSCVRPLG
ncbi:MAG TPA: thioesterase domain-containing protein [Steroidobacteraceae bacterium]|nr:thioesterase domain-containing protein [Steroidobacteraceae bacterium]